MTESKVFESISLQEKAPGKELFLNIDRVIKKLESEKLLVDVDIILKLKERYISYLQGLLKTKDETQKEENYTVYTLDEFIGLVLSREEKKEEEYREEEKSKGGIDWPPLYKFSSKEFRNYKSNATLKIPIAYKWGEKGGITVTERGVPGIASGGDIKSYFENYKKKFKKHGDDDLWKKLEKSEIIDYMFTKKGEEIFLHSLNVIPTDVTIEKLPSYIKKLTEDRQYKNIERGRTRILRPVNIDSKSYSIALETNIPGIFVRISHHEEENRNEIWFDFSGEFIKGELLKLYKSEQKIIGKSKIY